MWGFLRETTELAKKEGIDTETKLCKTGLDEYLNAIFPETKDWVHDKSIPDFKDSSGERIRSRPDYRSESLKLIVEFDGLPHYTNPDNILRDEKNTKIYEEAGYKVVRLPYFIQLTNTVVKQLFGISVEKPLFDENIPSIGLNWRNTPAYLCYKGVERMAKEFKNFPEQYKVNIEALKKQDPNNWTDWKILEKLYNE